MTMTDAAPPARAIHPIGRIVVGERGNRDLTGLDQLKASIVRDNLVHPLILTPDRHLVLGARRLEACRQLGWTDIPAMTVTWIWQALEYLETEHRNPRCLKPLTVSGTWRTSADPVRGLARKLTEEAGEFGEALDPGELYDLLDAVTELVALTDPDGEHLAAHQEKIELHGVFRDHVEWCPVPDAT